MSRVQLQITVDGEPWESFEADEEAQGWIDSSGDRLTTAQMFQVISGELQVALTDSPIRESLG